MRSEGAGVSSTFMQGRPIGGEGSMNSHRAVVDRAMPSGRGQSAEIPAEVLRASRAPQSAFRVTGLAYHAWEYKLRESPLPLMPTLDILRRDNASDPTRVNVDVMSAMTDLETLSGAFLSVYARHGSMEDAKRTLRDSARPWLRLLSEKLQNGDYTFPPLPHLEPKTMEIPKYDGTMHKMPIWWHKTVPEAIRLILEAVFEPSFLRNSHGYRPGRGCYSALKDVKYGCAGVDYFLVGDMSACMDMYDKQRMLEIIQQRISDAGFLNVMEACLRANYVDLSAVGYRNIGLPQTTLLSPILCNIYLHALDVWFDNLSKCLSVGGAMKGEETNALEIIGRRTEWSAERLRDGKAWKSPSLKGVRYVRYGNNLLLGVHGTDMDVEQLEVDLVRVIKMSLRLDYERFQFNRANATSPEQEYVVFLGAEVYVAPQISSPGAFPGSAEAGQLPNRPRLCVPARLLMKKLEESGFIDGERKRPRYVHRMVLWECHEIVKYYDILMKLFVMYYTFADNEHCLLLLYDVLKQSCSLTLARKLGLKRMWHVQKRLENALIVRDMEGVPLASFERPRFQRPLDPFIGRDINPFIRSYRSNAWPIDYWGALQD